MPKRRLKVSSFYGASATTPPILAAGPHGAPSSLSGDFDETLPYEATEKTKRLRAIEDVMDSTRSKRFRAIEDIMDSSRQKVRSKHFRGIEDIMDSSRQKVRSKHFRAIEDIMNSIGRVVKENYFRYIVDIMSSGGPIQAIIDDALVSSEEQFGKIVLYKRKEKINPFRAKVDKGKDICLDEERNILRGRIDSFMAGMHELIGPRTCTRWGGSVVDSIVGVYLTQSVSDHLSSSAFMSLAAKFPSKLEASEKPSHMMADLVGENMSNDTSTLPMYMELLWMQVQNACKNENKVTESLTKLLYWINPSLSVKIHPPSVPTLGAQLKDSENDFHEAEIDASETQTTSLIGKKQTSDFEIVRKEAIQSHPYYKEGVQDILDLEAIGQGEVKQISEQIMMRGMDKMLGKRIKDFLNKLITDHGRMELEWLRYVDPETAKDYLLNINGLGTKSVECVRLLTLHHKAFPVDTNVARICVRLGWVPLHPLPESLQLHLLEHAKLDPPGTEPEQDIEDCVPYYSKETRIINNQNRKNYMDTEIEDANILGALVVLTPPDAGSIPTPKLKNARRLRSEHQAYELPYNSPLLEVFDKTERDDTRPYLLCILNPGETAQSSDTPEIACKSQGKGELCESNACFHCNGARESQDQNIRGTILIPYQVSMRRKFPLYGTYFQVNEVFADHASSKDPIIFPRKWIDDSDTRKLYFGATRTVYFGASVPAIFRGLEIKEIVRCFLRGKIYKCLSY